MIASVRGAGRCALDHDTGDPGKDLRRLVTRNRRVIETETVLRRIDHTSHEARGFPITLYDDLARARVWIPPDLLLVVAEQNARVLHVAADL